MPWRSSLLMFTSRVNHSLYLLHTTPKGIPYLFTYGSIAILGKLDPAVENGWTQD